MVVFYHQITMGLVLPNSDFEGSLKFIIDLISALQRNKVSLSLLLNALVNNVLLSNISNCAFVLSTVRKLTALLEDYDDISHSLFE